MTADLMTLQWLVKLPYNQCVYTHVDILHFIIYIYTHIQMCMFTHVCVCVLMYIHRFMCMYVYVYVFGDRQS